MKEAAKRLEEYSAKIEAMSEDEWGKELKYLLRLGRHLTRVFGKDYINNPELLKQMKKRD